MIRILLIDDIPVFQSMIAAVLAEEADIQVVGTARTLKESLKLAPEADIVLVNGQMAENQAIKVVREIAMHNDKNSKPKILAIGLNDNKEEVIQYIRAGAVGYVLKKDSIDELLQKVRGIVAGKSHVSPKIAATLISYVNRYSMVMDQFRLDTDFSYSLTAREEEILELVCQGFTNRDIANQLVIEIGTVKNHIHNILKKMGVKNRNEAATRWVVNHRMKVLSQSGPYNISESTEI